MTIPLIEILHPDMIKVPLTGTEKSAVIRELVEVHCRNRKTDQTEGLLNAVLQREAIMSTGVGNGVAIPHCKSALSPEFSIVLGIHPGGIEFQSLDNLPAHIFFLLTGPEDNPTGHIRLLSRISRIISQDYIRQTILQLPDSESIFQYLREEERRIFKL